MEQRTCPVCGVGFVPRSWNQRYCKSRGRCYRTATNAAYRSQGEMAKCRGCGQTFTRVRGRSQRVYCSDKCHHTTKAQRLSGPRKAKAEWPPRITNRVEAAYRRVLRQDPCAYCGDRPAQGIDHIEPAARVVDRKDWTNLTGCCKRCNETKRDLPLLVALPWIPLSRAYHDQRRVIFSRPGG